MALDPSLNLPVPTLGPPEPAGFSDRVGKIFGRQPPATPPKDPYALSDQEVLKLLTDTREFCEPGRELFEYGWWRNLQYLLGRQWIYWNPTTRQWNDKRLAKWVPKPVTNIIRTTGVTIKSILSAIALSTKVRPNGNSSINLLTAQTADDLEPVLQAEHAMKRVMSEGDFWAIYTGNAYFHPCWDKSDFTHRARVAMEQCQLCDAISDPAEIQDAGNTCPACGSKELAPAMDPQNPTKPLVEDRPIGKGKTLAISPLELLMPLYAQTFEEVDRLIYLTWRPEHEVVDEPRPVRKNPPKKRKNTQCQPCGKNGYNAF